MMRLHHGTICPFDLPLVRIGMLVISPPLLQVQLLRTPLGIVPDTRQSIWPCTNNNALHTTACYRCIKSEIHPVGGKLSKGGFIFFPSMFYFCDPYLPVQKKYSMQRWAQPHCATPNIWVGKSFSSFLQHVPTTSHCNSTALQVGPNIHTIPSPCWHRSSEAQDERQQSSCLWCGRLSLSWMPNHPPAHLLMYLICISFFDISLIIFARNLCSAVLDKLWVL